MHIRLECPAVRGRAAAALVAAAKLPRRVGAVVSRGGRADLAGGALDKVLAPTLLIVGGLDFGVIELTSRPWPNCADPRCWRSFPGRAIGSPSQARSRR